MSDDQLPQAQTNARSFGAVAGAYHRGRPTYPVTAATWLTGPEPLTVLELGAGTGKLTSQLVALGHDVHATDPDRAMLDILARDLPDVRTSQSSAEEIPSGDRAYDVVVSAQAFHWFDADRALPEIARVLKPGGHLSLVWNQRDARIPWVRRLGAIIGTQDQLPDPAAALVASGLFGEVQDASFRFWQTLDSRSIQDLVLSRSNIATLDDAGRAAKVAEVLAFYGEYGRGMDGMQLPYAANCFRAGVIDRPAADGLAVEKDRTPQAQASRTSDGADTEMLLIDFR